jgi:tetratricopeptide (TPR) repeat protein
MRSFAVLTVAVLTVLITSAAAMDPEQYFEQGNTYFEAKQYDSAIIAYQQITDLGLASAPVYFNLGNAYFRNGDLGHAILNYLRAQRLAPADEDIAANLDFAQRFTSVQMEGVELNPVSSLFESIVAPYRLDTLAWVSSFFFILTVLFLIMRYGFVVHGSIFRVGITVSIVLLVSASILTTVKYRHDYLTQWAVIVAEECVVRTGPSDLSDKELDAAPGLQIQILAESGDYYNVLFENKRRGWIKKSLVAVV